MKDPDKTTKTRISVTVTTPYVEALDSLVEAGLYVSRGEAAKDALRRIFHHHGVKPFIPEDEEEAKGEFLLSEDKLKERIAALKESEASIRAE